MHSKQRISGFQLNIAHIRTLPCHCRSPQNHCPWVGNCKESLYSQQNSASHNCRNVLPCSHGCTAQSQGIQCSGCETCHYQRRVDLHTAQSHRSFPRDKNPFLRPLRNCPPYTALWRSANHTRSRLHRSQADSKGPQAWRQ